MAQFAGSRSLDERRRRRLATESDESAAKIVAAPAPRRAAASKREIRPRGPSHFPLRKVISPRLWKHGLVALVGLLLAAGILAGGWAAETHAARMGPGLAKLFDLSRGRLVRWYVASATFLTSELALLVWWLRSQSLQDFKGRYRGWAACALLGFLAVFAVETDAFRAWSETVAWLWHFDIRHWHTVSWMAPALLAAIPACRFLHREMRDNRTSHALLWLAVLMSAGLGALALSDPLPLPVSSARLVQRGLAMLAALCLLLSFLSHARHAIYVTVEPPAERAAWFVALWRRYRGTRLRAGKASSGSPESSVTAGGVSRRKRRPASKQSGELPEESAAPVLPSSKQASRVDQRQMRRSA